MRKEGGWNDFTLLSWVELNDEEFRIFEEEWGMKKIDINNFGFSQMCYR